MKKDAYIVVTGNLDEGFKFTGPFKSFDDASAYDGKVNFGGSWIARLHPPKSDKEALPKAKKEDSCS